ncbi:MAG: flavodoxin domain-containing protein [Elusimicrobia bacterium]|nr:flavodoxin domain-containing protein [Elusimicrobiota bacterium]MDY6039583.1 flavodoxin domain-containing protein [Elusimicrobiaceae bacterium]
MMQAVQISEKVYWVGAIDWNIRDFHGYSTKRGTTYNAYLIMSEKPTLIDTVKKEFYDEMMERIQSVIDPKKIQIIISNHSEMDHSGALPQAVEAIEPEEVYVSDMGFKDITAQFHRDLKLKTVKTGDRIDVGGDTVSFVEARMLHWPDSMFSYLEKENVLFTNDVFGMHYATGKLFDDENEERLWLYEAEKYYANIVLPYSDIVLRFLAQVQKMGLSPKMIAPDHGFIWRKDPSKIINLYAKWAAQAPNNKAVVVYDTMWGSTEKMACYITDGLRAGGTVVKQLSMHSNHRSDVVTELLDASALIIGSPVLNSNIFPAMADVLCYLKGLRKKGLVGAAFGSYGWNGAPIDELTKMLESMNVQVVAPAIKSPFVPDENIKKQCRDLGLLVSQKIAEKLK